MSEYSKDVYMAIAVGFLAGAVFIIPLGVFHIGNIQKVLCSEAKWELPTCQKKLDEFKGVSHE